MNAETQKAIVLAVMALVIYLASQTKPQGKQKAMDETPNAIVLVPPAGMAGSVLIDEWAKQNGYELRRYSENATVDDAEAWVYPLFKAAKAKQPAAAIAKNGDITVVTVGDDFLEELEKWK